MASNFPSVAFHLSQSVFIDLKGVGCALDKALDKGNSEVDLIYANNRNFLHSSKKACVSSLPPIMCVPWSSNFKFPLPTFPMYHT